MCVEVKAAVMRWEGAEEPCDDEVDLASLVFE